MSRNAQPSHEKPAWSGRLRLWGSASVAGLAALGLWIYFSPPNSFHPFCTHTVNAVVSAEVEVLGRNLSSTVVHQNSRSRGWISIMNSAGCKQKHGDALTYRLSNDNVLIVSARLCPAAEKKFRKDGHVDVLSACVGKQARQDRAYIVSSATRPEKWRPALNGVDFRILSMSATSTRRHPADDIDSTAPNLLKSYFEHDRSRGVQWSDSPETVIEFARRYELRKNRPDRSFEFHVKYGDF